MTRAKLLQNISVTAEDGIVYPLQGGRPVRFVHLDGTGMAEVRRILQRTPQQDGVTDRGYRLEPRKMTLALFIDGLTEYNADEIRDKLIYIFSPTTTALKLTCTRFDNTVRQIDCFVDGALDLPQSNRTAGTQLIIVPLLAPNPTFYDPTQQTTTASLSTGTGSPNIPAAGYSADDWPIIEVTGPITNLNISHSPSSDVLTITGTIPALETWRFDLRPGYKTLVRTSDNANRMNYVVTSTLRAFSTMRLLSEKSTAIYSQTANIFTCTGTGYSGASSISFKWYKRYLSL